MKLEILQPESSLDKNIVKYHNNICNQCKTNSFNKAICMLCGEMLCTKSGGTEIKDFDEALSHALIIHKGQTCFLHIYIGNLFLIFDEKIIEIEGLYQN